MSPKKLILEPKICPVIILKLSLLGLLTNPVVRHEFGAPLSHKVMYNLVYFLYTNWLVHNILIIIDSKN